MSWFVRFKEKTRHRIFKSRITKLSQKRDLPGLMIVLTKFADRIDEDEQTLLGRIGQQFIDPLLNVLKTDKYPLSYNAADILAKMDDDRVVEPLVWAYVNQVGRDRRMEDKLIRIDRVATANFLRDALGWKGLKLWKYEKAIRFLDRLSEKRALGEPILERLLTCPEHECSAYDLEFFLKNMEMVSETGLTLILNGLNDKKIYVQDRALALLEKVAPCTSTVKARLTQYLHSLSGNEIDLAEYRDFRRRLFKIVSLLDMIPKGFSAIDFLSEMMRPRCSHCGREIPARYLDDIVLGRDLMSNVFLGASRDRSLLTAKGSCPDCFHTKVTLRLQL